MQRGTRWHVKIYLHVWTVDTACCHHRMLLRKWQNNYIFENEGLEKLESEHKLDQNLINLITPKLCHGNQRPVYASTASSRLVARDANKLDGKLEQRNTGFNYYGYDIPKFSTPGWAQWAQCLLNRSGLNSLRILNTIKPVTRVFTAMDAAKPLHSMRSPRENLKLGHLPCCCAFLGYPGN